MDVIHGHSSHHVKAIEVYNGKLVLYGCGDFRNDYEGKSNEMRIPLSGSIGRRTNGEWERIKFVLQMSPPRRIDDLSIFDDRDDIHPGMAVRAKKGIYFINQTNENCPLRRR